MWETWAHTTYTWTVVTLPRTPSRVPHPRQPLNPSHHPPTNRTHNLSHLQDRPMFPIQSRKPFKPTSFTKTCLNFQVFGFCYSRNGHGHSSSDITELQVDFWTAQKQESSDRFEKLIKKDSRSSLKCAFRSLLIQRSLAHAPSSGAPQRDQSCLSLVMVTKEKKKSKLN